MMRRPGLWTGLLLMAAILPGPHANAFGARDDVARIVRLIGYGAGIHNFKNYVLRDRDEYRAAAQQDFTEALRVLDRLQGSEELDAGDRKALVFLQATLLAYNAALDRVSELRGKGWNIEDIDRTVIIDDTAAKDALERLRAKWRWTPLEEIEFELGYGRGIHNFKNYVLRGQQRYHTEALQNLLAVQSLVATQLADPRLGAPRRAALEDVARAAHAYHDHLSLVERLLDMQRSTRQIDLAVKINDGPAKQGLAVLRGPLH